MAQSSPNQETEIKLRAPSAAAAIELLTTHGFSVSRDRVFERNAVFDNEEGTLRSSGRVLRVREAGDQQKITFKGPGAPGRHKVREELEIDVSSAVIAELMLTRLGFRRGFIYEKFRTEFAESAGRRGSATVDETPIGTFLELEGEGPWIDEAAQRMGFQESDYITDSYGKLYLAWCAEHEIPPKDMTWSETATA